MRQLGGGSGTLWRRVVVQLTRSKAGAVAEIDDGVMMVSRRGVSTGVMKGFAGRECGMQRGWNSVVTRSMAAAAAAALTTTTTTMAGRRSIGFGSSRYVLLFCLSRKLPA